MLHCFLACFIAIMSSCSGLALFEAGNAMKQDKENSAPQAVHGTGVFKKHSVPPRSDPQQFPEYEIFARLPKLEAGSTVEVTLSISNPFTEVIEYSEARSMYSYLDFEVDQQTFAPNSTTDVKLTLRVPESNRRPDVFGSVELRNKETGKHIAQLVVGYEVSGNISLESDRLTLELSDRTPIAFGKVAVNISDPIVFEDLELSVSQNLRDLPVELKQEGNAIHVAVTASIDSVSEGGIGGEIRVNSKATGRGAGFYLALKKNSVIQVSPTSLQFRWKENSQTRQIAKAMIRISPNFAAIEKIDGQDDVETRTDENDKSVKKPRVTIRFGNESLPVEVVAVGTSGIFRVNTVIEASEGFDPDDDLYWNVQWGRESFELKAKAYFDK